MPYSWRKKQQSLDLANIDKFELQRRSIEKINIELKKLDMILDESPEDENKTKRKFNDEMEQTQANLCVRNRQRRLTVCSTTNLTPFLNIEDDAISTKSAPQTPTTPTIGT